jgi:hypothetical protein
MPGLAGQDIAAEGWIRGERRRPTSSGRGLRGVRLVILGWDLTWMAFLLLPLSGLMPGLRGQRPLSGVVPALV